MLRNTEDSIIAEAEWEGEEGEEPAAAAAAAGEEEDAEEAAACASRLRKNWLARPTWT